MFMFERKYLWWRRIVLFTVSHLLAWTSFDLGKIFLSSIAFILKLRPLHLMLDLFLFITTFLGPMTLFLEPWATCLFWSMLPEYDNFLHVSVLVCTQYGCASGSLGTYLMHPSPFQIKKNEIRNEGRRLWERIWNRHQGWVDRRRREVETASSPESTAMALLAGWDRTREWSFGCKGPKLWRFGVDNVWGRDWSVCFFIIVYLFSIDYMTGFTRYFFMTRFTEY